MPEIIITNRPKVNTNIVLFSKCYHMPGFRVSTTKGVTNWQVLASGDMNTWTVAVNNLMLFSNTLYPCATIYSNKTNHALTSSVTNWVTNAFDTDFGSAKMFYRVRGLR